MCEKKSDLADQVREKLTGPLLKAEILKAVKDLKQELSQIDANDEKIRKDKFDREQAEKEYTDALEKSGDVKQQIYDDQKKKDLELKTQQLLLAQ